MAKCKIKTFRWNKEERKVLNKPKRTYAILRNNAIVKVSNSKTKLKKLINKHYRGC